MPIVDCNIHIMKRIIQRKREYQYIFKDICKIYSHIFLDIDWSTGRMPLTG